MRLPFLGHNPDKNYLLDKPYTQKNPLKFDKFPVDIALAQRDLSSDDLLSKFLEMFLILPNNSFPKHNFHILQHSG